MEKFRPFVKRLAKRLTNLLLNPRTIQLGMSAMCVALICLCAADSPAGIQSPAAVSSAEVTSSAVTTTTATTTVVTTTTTTEYREEVVLEHPYYIQVDKTAQVVSVYTTNEEGKYEKLVRRMICSTGIIPQKFRDGMYKLSKTRWEWRTMLSHNKPMHAQYATVISGNYLFHSVPCSLFGVNGSLYESEFKKLGTACSGGCIRLTVEGAKWIYENCPAGTPVCVMTGVDTYDAELLDSLRPAEPADGWDPTDPHPDNPDYKPIITDPDPEPDKYAPLFEYNWLWGPSYNTTLTGMALKTTTTAATTATTAGTEPTTAVPAQIE